MSALLVAIVATGVTVLAKVASPGPASSATAQVPVASPVIVTWADFSTHALAFNVHNVDIPGARQELSDDRNGPVTTNLVKIEISIDEEDQKNLTNESAWLATHLPQACFDANYQDYKSAIADLKQASDLHLRWAQKYPNGDPGDLSQADAHLGSAWDHLQRAVLTAPLADPGQPCASA